MNLPVFRNRIENTTIRVKVMAAAIKNAQPYPYKVINMLELFELVDENRLIHLLLLEGQEFDH